MPRKVSGSVVEPAIKGDKMPDILDYIDEKEKEKIESGDKGAGDAPTVEKEDVSVQSSASKVSASTSGESVSKPKKAKGSKLSLKSKTKKGKQTKIEVKDEQEAEVEALNALEGKDNLSVTDSTTPKRRSFFTLGKKSTTKTPKSELDEQETKTVKPKRSVKNKLLTDFFPVRRSDRRSKVELEKIETERLERKILSSSEDGLKVVDIEGKGRGVVATKLFKRNDFVVVYDGDLITLTEAQAKEDYYSRNPDIGCYMYYFKWNEQNYCVDATAESGKLGRLLNHSKNGNCKTKVVGVGDRPYLILVAARDITKNEELLYDYGDRSKEALEAHPWLAS